MAASPSEQQLPKIYTLAEIEKVISAEDFQDSLIQATADGFVDFHRGDFYAAPIQTLGAPPMAPFSSSSPNYAAQTCVKSGYFRDNPYYVVKVASGGYPWENSGLMQVYSQKTGRLEALLLDDGVLTELRTAAVGALAASLLAPHTISCIGILGTGVQARYQLDMLRRVTQCRTVLVYGRTSENVESYRAEMEQKGWKVRVAKEADSLLKKCELIVTATSSREALLGLSINDTKPKNLLISCIGSDAPGKMELSTNLVGLADLRIADYPKQSRVRGEFQAWCQLQNGKNVPDDLCPLGQIISDKALHRQSDEDERFIIFDSSGVALQDCVIAEMVCNVLS